MTLPRPPVRPPDPDSLPDSDDPTGPCPRCGRPSNFTPLGWVPVSFREDVFAAERGGGYTRLEAERVTVLECAYCRQGTVVVERQSVAAGPISWTGIHWWPPNSAATTLKAAPVAVAEAFGEGLRALSAGAPRAATVMFRGTVETIVRDVGSPAAQEALKDQNLSAALRAMANEHVLTPELGSWAAEIRFAGNAGAHVDPMDPVTMDEANSLAKLTVALLEYLYELPARLARSRTSVTRP